MRTARVPIRFLDELAGYAEEPAGIPAPLRTLLREAGGHAGMATAERKRFLLKSAPRRGEEAREHVSAVERRTAVRAEVFRRAAGRCEYRHTGARCAGAAQEWDHQWGRRDPKDETLEATWALCNTHHVLKTKNKPDRIFWLERFQEHARARGYPVQVGRCEGAIQFERAQHPEKA